MTFLFYSSYTIGDIYPSFNAFYLRKSAVLKWKTLLPHINFPKTALVRCSVKLYFIYSYFKFRSGEKFMVAIFKSSLQNLSPLPTSFKVKPLLKPKTGLKFFVKSLSYFSVKVKTKVSTLSLSPG